VLLLPFALATLLSAFLLFALEPLIGKFLLPWFGGAPAVWTTCMLFFQLTLLGGYGYAHLLASFFSPRRQKQIHLGLMGLALVWMAMLRVGGGSPLFPWAGWKPPDSANPTARILLLLAASIGLPFLILSASGPLLQAWWSRIRPESRVYRLYSLSNAGSLLALLCYPTLIEPHLPLSFQAKAWAGAFLLFALSAGWCALRAGQPRTPSSPLGVEGLRTPVTGWIQRGLWVLLPAAASLLLLAATHQMCQEVAVIPFLWVLPLALYLVTFILCFSSERWYPRSLYLPALLAAILASTTVLYQGVDSRIPMQLAVYSFLLFSGCMVCHGELARLKPPPHQLTLFYFAVSLGGALGGLFVCLAAPHLFSGYFEFHLAIFLVASLGCLALVLDRTSWLYQRHPWPAGLTLILMVALTRLMADYQHAESLMKCSQTILHNWKTWVSMGGFTGLLAAILFLPKSRRHALLSSLMLLASLCFLGYTLRREARGDLEGVVYSRRNFFGVLAVKEEDAGDSEDHVLKLRHGRITHGMQFFAPDRRNLPTSYYGPTSGVGYALLHHPKRLVVVGQPGALRVGVIGLGVGTLAAYGHPGDLFRFYEINPLVCDVSWNAQSRFSYIKDCPARKELVVGDARLSLEREFLSHGSNHFDLLVVDAFTSDAIPMHLLTREAFDVYLKHLEPRGGILAVHVSNRNLNLQPVVWQLADYFGLSTLFVSDDPDSDTCWESDWFLLSPDHVLFDRSDFRPVVEPRPKDLPHLRLWTDDYSNLFQILIW
jgi:hypothetical protein